MFDVFEDEENHYIVMEYLAAGTLLDVLGQMTDKYVNESEAKKIVT